MRITKKNLVAGIGCTATLACAPTINAELITNGDFELPGGTAQAYSPPVTELGTHSYVAPSFGDTTLPSWTRTNADRGWYMIDDDGEFPDGSSYAFRLDANPAGGDDVLSQGGLNLVTGITYTLSLDYWAELATGALLNADLSGPAAVEILDELAADGTDGVADAVSVNFTVPVSGVYTLMLGSPENDNNHAFIDSVSIVPEPASLALMGLGGLMLWRRRG